MKKYLIFLAIPLIGLTIAGCTHKGLGSDTDTPTSDPGDTDISHLSKETSPFPTEDFSRKSSSHSVSEDESPSPPVPGDPTLLKFLKTSALPLGNTMYVWGGGWNEEDTGAGDEARSLGVSPRWAEFAKEQTSAYDYRNTRYQIHDGLDCSGYVGWAVYNTFETENGKEGYVVKSSQMAKNFSLRGWGDYTEAAQVEDYRPGDIFSGNGHVWICVAQCSDGSVILMHASPPGVMLSGTLLENGEKSQAVKWAEEYSARYFPQWHARFPKSACTHNYLKTYNRMRWNRQTLPDPDGLFSMNAPEILEKIFEGIS